MGQKNKLLFIITSSDNGGAQKHLYDLAQHLDKEKYIIEAACAPGGPLIEQLKNIGIRVFPVPFLQNAINPIRDFCALLALFNIIKKGKYHIVHCHSTKAGILGRIAAKFAGVPIILFTAHGFAFREQMIILKKILLIFMEKISAACCHRIITVSEHDRKDAIKMRLKMPSEIITIYNGINIDSLEEIALDKKVEIKKKIGFNKKNIVIGTIANFYGNKGYSDFLEAARLVLEEQAEARFISVGDGPLKNKMVRKAFSLGLNNIFFFAGYQSDALPFLSVMDIFLLSSLKEGFPYSILEAMAMKKPVVATNVGGIPEIVRNHETGILVKPANPVSLAEAILTLIKDSSLKEKIAINCREEVKNFDLFSMIEKTDDLYQNLVNNKTLKAK